MIKWKFMSRKAQIGMICSAALLLACPAASTYAQEETVDASQPAVTADAADTQPDHTPEGDVSADGELDGNQSAAEVKAEVEEIAKAEEGAEANAEEIAKAEAAVKAKEEEIAKAEAAAQAKAEEIAKAQAKAKEEAQWRKPPVSGKDGWNWHHGGWYYFRNGRPVSGWLQLGDTWYFMDGANAEYPYRMVSSSGRQINGKWYDFSSSGAMQRGWGWSDEAGGWYYHADLGNRRTGWLKDGGTWYYLDPANNGLMASNKDLKVSGSWYSFARSGAMRTGWVWTSEKGGWYYHAGWGGRTYGWLKNGGTWYYLDPADNGLMASNKDLKVSGSWYSFARSGAMRTGWVWTNESGGGWYYHAGWGGRSYGWANVGGTWYFLDSSKNGLMVHGGRHSVWGRIFWFTSSGAMRTGWIWEDGNWYYAGSDGAMKTGWQNTSSGRYYLYKYNDPNGGTPGAMAHDVTIDGIKIPSNGSASVAYGKAGKKLDQIGWDLKAAFRWSASMPYVNVSNSPSPGSEYFANYGFTNGRGDCYVMAATFYYMAKALGYDAHQMAGYVPLLNGGRGVHSWVEIDVNGGTYVFDPDFAHETRGSGYWFTYGTSGTWRYMDGYRMN